MRLTESRSLLYVLASVSLASSVALLLLAGWFVGASAVAGVLGGAMAFNYVLPAAAVRMLAITRIAASYATHYVGHAQLMDTLTSLRNRLFHSVMGSGKTELHAVVLTRLEQHSDAMANHSLLVVLPFVTAAVVLLGVSIFIGTYLTAQAAVWWWVLLLFMSALLWHNRRILHRSRERQHTTERFRSVLDSEFRNASNWSLSGVKGLPRLEAAQRCWSASLESQRFQEKVGEGLLRFVALGGVLASIIFLPDALLGSPLLLLLPLLLLSLPDWLDALVRAQSAFAETRLARLYLKGWPAAKPNNLSAQATTMTSGYGMRIRNFSWQRGECSGLPLNADFGMGDVVLITGDSGSGKSSLLMALSGLLNFQGTVHTEKTLSNPHYCEQYPSVLSDTLRNNLLIADPAASETRLQAALEFACLGDLKPYLDQWLGEQGRRLSGGERKRLGMARTWLANRAVWLLDEPFEGLDAAFAEQLAKNISLQKKHHIILLVSHRPVTALQVSAVISLPDSPVTSPDTQE